MAQARSCRVLVIQVRNVTFLLKSNRKTSKDFNRRMASSDYNYYSTEKKWTGGYKHGKHRDELGDHGVVQAGDDNVVRKCAQTRDLQGK